MAWRAVAMAEMTTDVAPPENRAAEAPRDPRGRMLPGTTLNPGGRPKAWREFQGAVRERSPQALAIIDRALKSKDPAQRQWAGRGGRGGGGGWGRAGRGAAPGGGRAARRPAAPPAGRGGGRVRREQA